MGGFARSRRNNALPRIIIRIIGRSRQAVLQTDGQQEGERQNPCQLSAHQHAVPVVELAGAAESLIDLQSLNADFGSTGAGIDERPKVILLI
jgi:hypothetical protein